MSYQLFSSKDRGMYGEETLEKLYPGELRQFRVSMATAITTHELAEGVRYAGPPGPDNQLCHVLF